MTSKRVEKIQRVLLFLLGIAGLLFISMYIRNYWLQEGFQTNSNECASIPSECKGRMIGNRFAYLCDPITSQQLGSSDIEFVNDSGSNSALTITGCVPNTSSVCYTSAYSLSNRVSGTKNYVCFDRPGQRIFDEDNGVFRDFNNVLDEDPLPDTETETVLGFAASYNSGFKKYYSALNTLTQTESDLNNLGFSNVNMEISNLQEIVRLKCSPPTQSMVGVCNTLSNTITTVSNIRNAGYTNSLSNVSTVIANSKNSISTVVHGTLEPNYYNSGVMAPAQITEYETAHRIAT